MVFLIEGVDGVGKSTLFEGLRRSFPQATFLRESYPGSDVNGQVVKGVRVDMLRANLKSPETFIYDRATALDELIYEPVIAHRTPKFTWESVKPLLERCVILYLTGDQAVIAKRLDQRGDQYIGAETLGLLEEKYNYYFSQLSHNQIFTIDTTKLSDKEVLEAAEDAILRSINLYSKKVPKLAHIIPRDLLRMTINNQYHMSLAHLIYQDPEYTKFYRSMVASGRYVLMDNGAAENAQLNNEQLLECWSKLHPTELVLPDTLCDREDTIRKTQEAIGFFRSHGVTSKFMAVPQGETLEDWEKCANALIRMREVHCLGVSKFLTIQTKDPEVRYKAVKRIEVLRRFYGRYDLEVHLLGCDVGPSEPEKIFKEFDFVRGCDTALAYIYAQAGVDLTADSKRPAGEMSFIENTLSDTSSLEKAMNNFNEIAGVVNNFGDYTWF